MGSVDGDDADLLYTTFLRAIEAKVAEKCGMHSGIKNALKSDFEKLLKTRPGLFSLSRCALERREFKSVKLNPNN